MYFLLWVCTIQERPEAHKLKNKAVYTAELVADGWAGAENLKKELYDEPTDQPKSGLYSN